jgi:hypothetical protein
MAVEKWIAGSGVGLTWTNAFTPATLDSIVNGNAIMSAVNIDNSSVLDVFADFSMGIGTASPVAPNYIGVYLYPLNKDGTSYGDGRFGSSFAGPPGSPYWVGNIVVPTGGPATNSGIIRGIILPPGQFKFVVYNQLGVTMAGSNGNTAQYRTYNRQVV